MISFKDNSRQLVVIVSTTNWNEYPRFRHQVTRQLKKYYNVLYVEKYCKKTKDEKDGFEIYDDNMIIYRCSYLRQKYRVIYSHIRPYHSLIDYLCRKKIEDLVKLLGNERVFLVNFVYHFSELMKSSVFRKKIYICNDDFTSLLKYPWQKKMYQNYEDKVVRIADICLVHSGYLYDKFRGKNRNIYIMEPGHEFVVEKKNKKINNDDHKIRVCYMGYVDERLNSEWLSEILLQQNMELYFIGPVSDKFEFDSIGKYGKINFIKPLLGCDLYKKMNDMDVFIIPYDLSHPIVKACVPNKLYQYMACGKPIVISNMPQIIGFEDCVISKASDKIDFIKKINKMYCDDSQDKINKRYEIAENNTWDKRGVFLYSIINELLS
ncbi:glycosyltransferase family 1 protein [Chlorobaculum thiosulfatiphilum]|uniref:Glycosyltransferase family 1 protein n=1 Tax=Chlorobaculum thiosulfatiphilum TaxID=115852 RepID=A0A5C4S5J3_CHLTI|nr:glycosyltransferase [Chlorobaculum thiosulfatiphilum]TNJ38555.1 glycosyltransferase family 1 protein [Chlorobaculum thiosulfatiphilum]